LGDVAARGVGSAGDDEKGVHVAVGDTVGLLEARFADWTIDGDEPGDDVLCAVQSGDRDQRILRGARAARGRLRVAREALIGVEARAEAIVRAAGHDFDVSESRLAILEEGGFVRGKTTERTAGAWRVSAHVRIDWP
jgi:hypothetical protein